MSAGVRRDVRIGADRSSDAGTVGAAGGDRARHARQPARRQPTVALGTTAVHGTVYG